MKANILNLSQKKKEKNTQKKISERDTERITLRGNHSTLMSL